MASKHENNQHIFVLVPGLPGWGLTNYYYWDTLTFDSQWIRELNAKLFVVEPGPISSYHDRACEVFAQLYGIKTDFGDEHSTKFDHFRYGRDFTSSFSLKNQWTEQNPIHFICHSSGTNTVRYLQFLLSKDFWNFGTSENWIKSIISISGNINGTQFLHFFGADSITGLCSKEKLLRSAKRVYKGAKWSINKLKNITEIEKNSITNWHLEHWNICMTNEKCFLEMEKNSNIFINEDNIFYDLTIHGSDFLNSEIPETFPNTYYIGFCGKATDADSPLQISHQINPVLLTPATYILNNKFHSGKLASDIFYTNRWCNNDGFCSVASQAYPMKCEKVYHLKTLFPYSSIEPGCWYYSDLQEIIGCKCIIDHFSMIWCRSFLKGRNFQLKDYQQKEFYCKLLNFIIYQN